MVEERRLVEGDAAAGGARGEEALRLLVVGTGHGQTFRLVHPDGNFCREETEDAVFLDSFYHTTNFHLRSFRFALHHLVVETDPP